MKKVLLILTLLFSLFLFSCVVKEEKKENNPTDNDNTQEQHHQDQQEQQEQHQQDDDPIKEEQKPFASIDNGDLLMPINDNVKLLINKSSNAECSYLYDDNVIRINDDVINAYGVGETDLSLVLNGEVVQTIHIIVFNPQNILLVNLPSVLYVGYTYDFNYDDLVVSFNNDILSFDSEIKRIVALSEGEVTIRVSLKYDETLYREFNCQVEKKITLATTPLVKANANTDVIIDDIKYVYGETLFNTLSEVINKYNKIYLESTNEKEITINRNGISIIGISDDELDLTINIGSNISNVTIKKLTFTKDSHINLLGGNSFIIINNNKFKNTTVNSSSWLATNKYTSGIITSTSSDNYIDVIYIDRNQFINIGDCAINLCQINELSCSYNYFDTFSKDAIRVNDGKVTQECTWNFTSNTFINGEYSGIYLRTYSSDTAAYYHNVIISNNNFDNVGKNGGEYVASIVFRNYQEGLANITIRNNEFNNGKKYIFLRNNAIVGHQENFCAMVYNNTFKSIPSGYYFNNLNSSDTFEKNPKQAVLYDNCYLDNGLDITPNESKIIGAKSSTTISKEDLEKKEFVEMPNIVFVGVKYEFRSFFPEEEGYFEYSDGYFTPIKEGETTLFNYNDPSRSVHQIKIVKRVELVVKFINIALGEIGYEEMDANGKTGTSGNYTKYGEWYGLNPGAWCAMFVSWCASQAGVSTSVIPKYASVSIGMEWYKERGLFQYKEDYTPKAGDIMFMKSNGASHTGIVLYCDGKTLYTVEGNTSDKVALRKYDVTNAKITGYGTPQWEYYSPDGYNFSSGEAQDGTNFSTR